MIINRATREGSPVCFVVYDIISFRLRIADHFQISRNGMYL